VVDRGLSQLGPQVLAKHVHNAIAIGAVDKIDDHAGAALPHAHMVIVDADVSEHEIEAHHCVGTDQDA
jgi:hypothetical protein